MVAGSFSTQADEQTTQEIAYQLLSSMQGERSWLGQVLEPIRLDNKLLAWSMSDPNLRVQLFRLIDVLPILSNPADVASHLQEYLTAVDLELPVVLKQLLKFATPNSLRGDIAARVFKASVSALAHQYIAGETFPQLSKVIAKLRSQGMAFSVDCLGEAVLSETEAASYRQGYLDLITIYLGRYRLGRLPRLSRLEMASLCLGHRFQSNSPPSIPSLIPWIDRGVNTGF